MWQVGETRSMQSRLRALYVGSTIWLMTIGRVLRSKAGGQSMVEYAIVVALVAIVAMAAVQSFGQGISQVFQQLLSQITSLGG